MSASYCLSADNRRGVKDHGKTNEELLGKILEDREALVMDIIHLREK